jgi:pSer/pThr/pTyr-binding forkhead associated (FHA) protein
VELADVTVSRRHAEIRPDRDQFLISDGGSLNGTYVNRRPVDTVTLSDGDEIAIGIFRLVFSAS